jgi:hypothetical protein
MRNCSPVPKVTISPTSQFGIAVTNTTGSFGSPSKKESRLPLTRAR